MKNVRFRVTGCRFAPLACLVAFLIAPGVRAGDGRESGATVPPAPRSLTEALPPERWREVERSVDRALEWLALQQREDGSFPSIASGQPGITSLAIMAFLSRGHQPGAGPHGDALNRAIDFVLASQQADGLFSYEPPEERHISHRPSHTATYNHAISGLMLGEVYGQVTGDRAREVRRAIEKALLWTRQLQVLPKRSGNPLDKGGWRYVRFDSIADSDLSITAWQLMFLRSARNAEFDVPQEYVDEALAYVRRCFDANTGAFHYALSGTTGYASSRGMVGAGILSLSMAGQHRDPMALAAGDWLLQHPFGTFGEVIGPYDKVFYSSYYCSQAAAQLGGRHWDGFFPPLVDMLLRSQQSDGSWPPEPTGAIAKFGNAFTTSMAVLSLTPPYQLLPVYQR